MHVFPETEPTAPTAENGANEVQQMEQGNGDPEVRNTPSTNSFDPGFLGSQTRNMLEERESTRHQQNDLLTALADSKDEATQEKLGKGVKPGEFFDLFVWPLS